jgi:uncharacterized protein YcfJ
MNTLSKISLAVAGLALVTHAAAQITLYEHDGFEGRSFTTQDAVRNFERAGFNDRASSIIVRGERNERWEVCEDRRFSGHCVILRRGQYPSLAAMGLNDRVSSVRSVGRDAHVDDNRYAPPPPVAYDYRRRDHERLYQAEITSVRAVVGTPTQRCWVDREQVSQTQARGDPNIGGAVLGAVIGGILGHQVGGGSGRDVATAIGVVGGAAVGANAGRNDGGGQRVVTQDVQRCTSTPDAAHPDYWDVSYHFRGQDYRMQMSTPPGAFVTVNQRGEPRA